MISVDQTPLGSTPNSTPATYSGAFDLIRELFAKLPEAKVRGYSPRRFSFNQAGGRCEACEGAGQKRIEMHFLPDVWITCDACGGAPLHARDPGRQVPRQVDRRRARHVGRRRARAVRQRAARSGGSCRRSHDVGLGYVSLGQSAPTLSGGEAQRVKLAAELARPDTGQDALHPRRADDRPALRRRPQAARRAPPPGRPGQHGRRDRAQPRGDQDGRLGHRPRPRGRSSAAATWSPRERPRRSSRTGAATPESSSSRCSRPARGANSAIFAVEPAAGKGTEEQEDSGERKFDTQPSRLESNGASASKEEASRRFDRAGERNVKSLRRAPTARRKPPGKSTGGSGTLATASPATAALRGGTAESSSGSSTASKSWVNPRTGFAPTDWSQRGVVRINSAG